jgi:fluoride exporter
MTWLLVALGAALGAPARYLADRAVQTRALGTRPWGTMTVNVAGSFVFGIVASAAGTGGWAALVGTGFCGALTTYSTFGYETLHLAMRGDRAGASWNIGISTFVGVAAAALGWSQGSAIAG